MEERLLLVDSDIFILLAGAGMLDRAIELFGFSRSTTRRLEALPYQLRKWEASGSYPRHVCNAALQQCRAVAALTEQPMGLNAVSRLLDVKGIHSGEAVLYALLMERPSYYLASGDKRGMVAVATAPELADIRSAVAGRIICLEAVLGMLIREDGPDAVKAAFVPLCTCNKSLTVFFSETDCLEAVHSYFNDLVRQTGEGFLMVP